MTEAQALLSMTEHIFAGVDRLISNFNQRTLSDELYNEIIKEYDNDYCSLLIRIIQLDSEEGLSAKLSGTMSSSSALLLIDDKNFKATNFLIYVLLQIALDFKHVMSSFLGSKHIGDFNSLLFSQSADSKTLCMYFDVLHKFLTSSWSSPDTIEFASIVDMAMHLSSAHIASKELQVSEKCCVVTEFILSRVNTTKYLPPFMAEIQKYRVADGDARDDLKSQILMRYAVVLACVLGSGESQCDACIDSGATDIIMTLCNSNDILLQLVALDDLLIHFASTKTGVHYLFASGMINWLVTCASGENSDGGLEPDPLLSVECLRVVGQIFSGISKHNISVDSILISQDYRQLMMQILAASFTHLDTFSDSSRLAGIGTLSDYASSSHIALEAVVSDKKLLFAWISLLQSKVEVQSAVLHSLAAVMNSTATTIDSSSGAINDDSLIGACRDMKKKILETIGEVKNQNPIEYLIKTARQPIVDLSAGAYDLLIALSKQSGWGVQVVAASKGLRGFLEDRDTEVRVAPLYLLSLY